MAPPQTPAELFDLHGRTAIVTGASSGLGARFAAVLHTAGANVVLAARRADRLAAVAEQLPGTIAVPTDVTDDAALQRLVGAALEAHGRVDVLVNNAGTTSNVRAENETPEQFRAVVEVNLVAVHRLAQLSGKVMLGQGSGAIVNVASMYGLVGRGDVPIGASYPATKAAVVNLTRELAAQWGRRGVRVNAIAPGYFRSEMTEDGIDDPRFIARMERRAPLARPGLDHELDGVLLFLASDASSYVTGQTIAVDGGWTAI